MVSTLGTSNHWCQIRAGSLLNYIVLGISIPLHNRGAADDVANPRAQADFLGGNSQYRRLPDVPCYFRGNPL